MANLEVPISVTQPPPTPDAKPTTTPPPPDTTLAPKPTDAGARIEQPLTEVEIRQRLDEYWKGPDGAIHLVVDQYETEQSFVIDYLKKAKGVPDYQPTDAEIQAEIKRREETLSHESSDLQEAVRTIHKARLSINAADAAVKAAKEAAEVEAKKTGKPAQAVNEAEIRGRYIAGNGVYYEVDDKGNLIEVKDANGAPQKVEVRLARAVKPIVTQLTVLSTRTEAGKPGELTAEAKRAKEIHDFLDDRKKEESTGGYTFDPTPDLEIIHRQEILQTDENVAITVARYLQHEFNSLQTGGDKPEPIIEITTDEQGHRKIIVNQERLAHLNPNERLGTLTLMLGNYQTASEEARHKLAYSMYAGLKTIKPEQLAKITDATLQKSIREYQKGNDILDARYKYDIAPGLLKRWELPEGVLLEPENIPQAFFWAYACEGHLTAGELPKEIEEALKHFNASTALKRGILQLAQQEAASKYLSSELEFNLETLNAANAAQVYGEKAVEAMDQRLQLSDDEKAAYKIVGPKNIAASAEKIKKQLKLPGWVKPVGLMALLSFPGLFQAVAGFGLESEEQGRK